MGFTLANPMRIHRDIDKIPLIEGQLLYRQNPTEKARVELFCDLMVDEGGVQRLKRCNLLGSDIGPSVPTITVVEPLYGATRSTLLALSGEESIVFFKYVRFIAEESPAGDSAKPYSCLLQKTDGSNVSIIAVDGHGQYHTGRSASFEDPSKWSGWEDSLGSRDSWTDITLEELKNYPQRYPSTLDIIEGSFIEDDSPDNSADSKWYVSCYFYEDHTQIVAESLYYQYSNTWNGTKWTGWVRTDGGDKIHYNTDPQVDVTKVELHEVALDDMALVSGTWEDIFSEVEFADTDQPAAGDVAYRVHIKKLADGVDPELGVFTMEAFYENRRFYCEYFDSTTGWSDWIEEATPSNTVFHYPTALTAETRDALIPLVPPEVELLDYYLYYFDSVAFASSDTPTIETDIFTVLLEKTGTDTYDIHAHLSNGVEYYCSLDGTWSAWTRSLVSHSDHDSIRVTTLKVPVTEETKSNFISISNQETLTDDSIEIGFDNTMHDNAIVIGSENESTGDNTIVIGKESTGGLDSIVIGDSAEALDNSTVVGKSAKAENYGVAVGLSADAKSGLAIGREAYITPVLGVSSQNSIAIGYRANAKGDKAIAIGGGADAQSTVLGYKATGESAIAPGVTVRSYDKQEYLDLNRTTHDIMLKVDDKTAGATQEHTSIHAKDCIVDFLGDTLVDEDSTLTVDNEAELTIHGDTIVDEGSSLLVGDKANSKESIVTITAPNVTIEGSTYIRNEDTTVNIGTNTDPSTVQIDGVVKVIDQAESTLDEDNLILKNDEFTFEMARNTTDDEIEIRDLTDPLHPKTLQPFNLKLDDLADVDVPLPANGEALVYDDTDPTNKHWKSADISTGELWGAPVGTVTHWSALTPPVGWLVCDGSTIRRAQYARLYNKIVGLYGDYTAATCKLPDFDDTDPNNPLGKLIIFTGNSLEEMIVTGVNLDSDETKFIRFDKDELDKYGYIDNSGTFHKFYDPATDFVIITGTSGTFDEATYNALIDGTLQLFHQNTLLERTTNITPSEWVGSAYTQSGDGIKIESFKRVVIQSNRTWNLSSQDCDLVPHSVADEGKVLVNNGALGAGWKDLALAELNDVDADSKGVGKFLTYDPTTGKFTFSTLDISSLGIVGEIRNFAGTEANIPDGWFFCRGQAVSRTAYSELFAVIGTTYGAGDGATTFNLPDLTSRFIEGCDQDPDTHVATNVGQKLNAGIPNIKGYWNSNNNDAGTSMTSYYSRQHKYGALYCDTNYTYGYSLQWASNQTSYPLAFDAAKGECGTTSSSTSGRNTTYSNKVYGKSDTVQPASYKMIPIICYQGFRKQS